MNLFRKSLLLEQTSYLAVGLIATASVFLALAARPTFAQIVTVTARIDSKTENGVTTERHYDENQVFFKSVEISREGDTLVQRTSNTLGQPLETSRVTEAHATGDTADINRTVTTKIYVPGSRNVAERIVVNETEGLHNLSPIIKNRTTTKRVYAHDGSNKVIETVTEEFHLLRIDENGVPIFEGTRTTKNKDGETIEPLFANRSLAESEDMSKAPKPELPEEVAAFIKLSCQSILQTQKYGLSAGPFDFGGDWIKASTAAIEPFYQAYQKTMSEKKDGEGFKFGQVQGYYKQLAYDTLIKVSQCNLSVLRFSQHFADVDIDQAKKTACDLRGYMATIFDEEQAQTVGHWQSTLLEMDDLDPCN